MNDDGSISITATAEDANLEIPVTTSDTHQTTTIKTEQGGLSSISVEAGAVEAGSTAPAELTMPEKFANAENPQEALLKAYTDLEQKLSGSSDTPKEAEEGLGAADKALESLQTDRKKAETVDTYSKLWAKQNGELTEEQWGKASQDLGIDVADLKAYESYRKDSISNSLSDNDKRIYELSGGEEGYNKMIDWAESNMSQGQLDALNNQLDTPEFSEMGVNMLKTLYTNSVGQEPQIDSEARANSTNNGEQFFSELEVLEAQKHPEYGRGGAYDQLFDKKLLRYMKASKQI
jgi:hypothetical protein